RRPAVDQHQHLVGEAPVEAAEGDVHVRRIHLGDVDAGHAAQDLRNGGGAGEADLLLADDGDGGGRLLFGGGADAGGDDLLLEDVLGLRGAGGAGQLGGDLLGGGAAVG